LSSTTAHKAEDYRALTQRRRRLKESLAAVMVWSQHYLRQQLVQPLPTTSSGVRNKNNNKPDDPANVSTSTARAQQMIKSLNRSKIVVREILESTVAANDVLDEDADSLDATGRVHVEYGSTMSKASLRLAEMKRLEELANTRMKWSFGFFVCVWLFVVIRRLPFLNIFVWVVGSVVPKIGSLFRWAATTNNSTTTTDPLTSACEVPQLLAEQYEFGTVKNWPSVRMNSLGSKDQGKGDKMCVSGSDGSEGSDGGGAGCCSDSGDGGRHLYMDNSVFPVVLDLTAWCSYEAETCALRFACCGSGVAVEERREHIFTKNNIVAVEETVVASIAVVEAEVVGEEVVRNEKVGNKKVGIDVVTTEDRDNYVESAHQDVTRMADDDKLGKEVENVVPTETDSLAEKEEAEKAEAEKAEAEASGVVVEPIQSVVEEDVVDNGVVDGVAEGVVDGVVEDLVEEVQHVEEIDDVVVGVPPVESDAAKYEAPAEQVTEEVQTDVMELQNEESSVTMEAEAVDMVQKVSPPQPQQPQQPQMEEL